MDPLLVSTSRSFHNTLNEGPLITLMNPRIIPSGSYTWPVAPAAPSSLILLAHLRLSPTAHYIPRPFSFERVVKLVRFQLFSSIILYLLPSPPRRDTLHSKFKRVIVSSALLPLFRIAF